MTRCERTAECMAETDVTELHLNMSVGDSVSCYQPMWLIH